MFIREVDPSAGGRDQRWIEAEASAGLERRVLINDSFDAGEDKLAGRTTLLGRRLV
jgi:hypothetical protein